jgi:hypothetical protein
MVAAFEQYLKEAVSEALESINTAAPKCDFDRLPESIRVSVVYASLEAAMRGDHATARLTRAERLPDVLAAVARIHRRVIDASTVAQTAGNPTSEQVKSIFKSIGLTQVLNNVKRAFDARWGGPTATTFIPDTLDSIVRRRHTVAHTASALNVTRVDLAEGHRFLGTLVGVVDAALDRHAARVIAAAQ